MTAVMNPEMSGRIDAVLDRVKDPESGLTAADLGVVKKLRYNAEKKELYIFSDFLSRRPSCPSCAGIASLVIEGFSRDLLAAFTEEFPDLTTLIVE